MTTFQPGLEAKLQRGTAVRITNYRDRWYENIWVIIGPTKDDMRVYVTFGKKSKYPYQPRDFSVIIPGGPELLALVEEEEEEKEDAEPN